MVRRYRRSKAYAAPKAPQEKVERTYFEAYGSLGELAQAASTIPRELWQEGSFGGYTPMNRQLSLLQNGSDKYVERAQSLLDSIDASLDVESYSPTWSKSVVGSSPSVASYLAGHPASMNRMTYDTDDRGPIRVLVNTTSSGMIDSGTLVERGVYTLALTMAIARVRPVELWVYCAGLPKENRTDSLVAFKVGTHPVDLSGACVALCETFVSRSIAYGLMCKNAGGKDMLNLQWPTRSDKELLTIAGLYDSSDVIIPALHVRSEADLSLAWVETQLRKALAGGADSLADGTYA